MREGMICDSCGKLHLDPLMSTKYLAAQWGFFLCGMANEPHKKETWVRTTILKDNVRYSIRTMKPIEGGDK